MKFGDYLRGQREEKDWTQPTAAKEIGIEQSYLSKLETGKAYPSDEIFEKLQKAYGFDIKTLGTALFDGELAKLRGIGALRDFAVQRERAEVGAIRKWILAGLALLTLGAGLTAYELHKPRQSDYSQIYLSKGKILPDEDDFVLSGLPSRAELEAVKANINRLFTPDQLNAIRENGGEIPVQTSNQLSGFKPTFKPTHPGIDCYDKVKQDNCAMGAIVAVRILDTPKLDRLDEAVMTLADFRGSSFTVEYDGGKHRRVFNWVRQGRATSFGPNNLILAIGIAMMVAGLYAGVMARRWR